MGHDDLVTQVMDLLHRIERALGALRRLGKAKAETERDYRIERAKQMLIKRDNGMPATLIGDVVKGDEAVAELHLKRDIAESEYRIALEGINVYKLEIKVLDEQISREWHRA